MRCMIFVVLAATTAAQSTLQLQNSHTTESLRGVSAVSRRVIWASGTHGTYLRTTDGGRNWTAAQVPDADKLDFRAVVAFSADEAFLMSAGPGDQSRIYHTSDSGVHWELEYKNTNPKAFFDSMVFWDRTHGLVLGDPIPNESGKLKFELLKTDDALTWTPISSRQMPEAVEGEGAFAASNTCIAILGMGQRSSGQAAVSIDSNIWFATGGKSARVFHSPDGGASWQVFDTPIVHGAESAGIFSIAFRDALHGVIAGGDYRQPKLDGPNLAFTEDGGKTWALSPVHPQEYFSALTYQPKSGHAERLFVVAAESVLDLRPPTNLKRVSAKVGPGSAWNAISVASEGGAWVAGLKGILARVGK